MMKINKIWEELENDASLSHGLGLRRYSGAVLPNVFIGVKLPEKFRCIVTSLNKSINVNLTLFSNLKDICVEIIPDQTNEERVYLLFILLSYQHKDIFSVLCEDLIAKIETINDENLLLKELLNRFDKWKSLFDKTAAPGLLPEEQRGLYGEIFFLRKYLQNNLDYQKILTSWIGPEKQIRDFQYGNWSVEVKTTHGNNHQKLHISSERQLDSANLENLFLYHLSLEVRQNSGETLNDIVDSVSKLLINDFSSLNLFKFKLLEAGYFDIHHNLYAFLGYFIRQNIFYKVENDFPRIVESEILQGVGDVKYSIVISHCSNFVKSESKVFQKLVFYD